MSRRACHALLTLFLLSLSSIGARAQGTVEWLHRFDGEIRSIAQASDGSIYGLTSWGGAEELFRRSPAGEITTISSFASPMTTPHSLVLSADGNFYGLSGGSSSERVFKVTPDGDFSVLYDGWTSDPTKGRYCISIIEATDGNLYGVCEEGGSTYVPGALPPNGYGVVFKLTRSGEYTVLHNFTATGARSPSGRAS